MSDFHPARETTRPPKCVVWDLDGTLWPENLSECGDVRPSGARLAMIRSLDRVGILQSIASRNDLDAVMPVLRRHGLADYFIHPEIHMGDKSRSLVRIARALNIGLDALLFVDDDPFERAEVSETLCDVRSLAPEEFDAVAREWLDGRVEMTTEAMRRRHLYHAESQRAASSKAFGNNRDQFLASLGLEMTIRPAGAADLERVGELAERTNRMNSAGRAFTREQIREMAATSGHGVLVASLKDRFGDYGTIAAAITHRAGACSRIRLFMVSCRVINRGAGGIFLNWMVQVAKSRNERLEIHFAHSPQNRPLYVTLRFAGFGEIDHAARCDVLSHDGRTTRRCPPHVRLDVAGGAW